MMTTRPGTEPGGWPAAGSGPFTVDDLERMPDDGRRYELVDGTLLVSPAPIWRHQEVGLALAGVLRAARPRDLRVVIAPFDWKPTRHDCLEPDVLVAPYGALAGDASGRYLVSAPLLAVEVLSPSSRRLDRGLKQLVYQGFAVPSYWLVDPDPDEPALTAYELGATGYQQVAHVVGDERWTAARPFAVTLCPAELVTDLHP